MWLRANDWDVKVPEHRPTSSEEDGICHLQVEVHDIDADLWANWMVLRKAPVEWPHHR